MGRPTRSFLAVLLVALVTSCATSAGSARMRRALDEARPSQTPAEIWPEVQRFLDQRGYPLVGEDRVAVGKPAQGFIARLFSVGFQTSVLADGSRVLETGPQGPTRMRVRVEASPAEGGGSRLRVRVIKRAEMDELDTIESRDTDLEIALLEHLDSAAAARVTGRQPPPAVAAPGPAGPPSAPRAAAVPVSGRHPSAAVAASGDRWARIRSLLGSWTGELADGTPVRWRFDFAGDGQFIEVSGTPLLFTGPDARPGREEMGRISSAAEGDSFAWNQFTSAGRVDRYEATAPPTQTSIEPATPIAASCAMPTPAATSTQTPTGDEPLVFVAQALESLPAGARVRLTLRRIGEQLEATLDIAEPGKDFAPAGTVRLTRVP